MAEVAGFLGMPLHPAQRLILDVSMELDPKTNTLVYSTVIILIHRQFGKSSLTLPRWVYRARRWPNQDMIYTAQRGKWATKKFKTDFVRKLRASPLVESPVRATRIAEGAHYRVLMGSGAEGIEFPNGSTITVSAPGEDSGHGTTLDEAVVDEAFVHETADVDSGFGTPMITRGRMARESRGQVTPGPQKWIVSAGGHDRSTYLLDKRAIGRAAVERGDDEGICYFEWSCPEDWDITDRSLWWFYIPALGHLMDEKDVARELAEEKSEHKEEWRRAYATQFHDRRNVEESPISVDDWGRLVDTSSEPTGRLVYGVAVSVDRQHASIGVAAPSTRGGLHVELVAAGAGTGWVVGRLAEILAAHGGAAVAVDPGSPAGSLVGEIERALVGTGVELVKMSARDHAAACGALVDRVSPPDGQAPGIRHVGQGPVDAAVAGAKKRQLLADAWALDRKKPEVDVSPLESIVMALGGCLRLPDEVEDDNVSVYEERGFVEW